MVGEIQWDQELTDHLAYALLGQFEVLVSYLEQTLPGGRHGIFYPYVTVMQRSIKLQSIYKDGPRSL